MAFTGAPRLVLTNSDLSLLIGPLVSSSDGYTLITAPILHSEIRVSKNHGEPVARNNTTPSTHAYGGHHSIDFDSATLSAAEFTPGEVSTLDVIINKPGAIPIRRTFPIIIAI